MVVTEYVRSLGFNEIFYDSHFNWLIVSKNGGQKWVVRQLTTTDYQWRPMSEENFTNYLFYR